MKLGLPEADEKNISGSIEHEARNRTYLLHLPLKYNSTQRYPLVLVLHGGGGNAANAARQSEMSAKADREGFIVVYPNGTGRTERFFTWNAWNCCDYAFENKIDDVGFFRKLIAKLESEYSIDPNQIYATGFSNGAMMCHRLAVELSEKIAAIAPVAGSLNSDDPKLEHPVSVLIIHGTADDYVLYAGGAPHLRYKGNPRIDRCVAYAKEFWVKHNVCKTPPEIKESGNIIHEIFSSGKNATSVEVYTIKEGGHSWPGSKPGLYYGNINAPSQEIHATNLIWDFFKHHARK
jgi:polyhydroxybutyrate depolymerase